MLTPNRVFAASGVTARTGILQVRLGADGVESFAKRPVTIEPVLR